MLPASHHHRNTLRPLAELTRVTTMMSQAKKLNTNFCIDPSQQATATANHHAGCFRASCAKTIISVVKNISPLSSNAWLVSVRNSGHETKRATLSEISHGLFRSSKKASHARASPVRLPKINGQMRTANSRLSILGSVQAVSQYCKGGLEKES